MKDEDEEKEKEKEKKEEEEQEQAAGSEMIVINARSTNSTSVYSGPLSKFDPQASTARRWNAKSFTLKRYSRYYRTITEHLPLLSKADTSTSFARVRTSSRRGI